MKHGLSARENKKYLTCMTQQLFSLKPMDLRNLSSLNAGDEFVFDLPSGDRSTQTRVDLCQPGAANPCNLPTVNQQP